MTTRTKKITVMCTAAELKQLENAAEVAKLTLSAFVRTMARTANVSPVEFWRKQGHFDNDDEVRGAYKLAHQQFLDGLGGSCEAWLGITKEQCDAWRSKDVIPGVGGLVR